MPSEHSLYAERTDACRDGTWFAGAGAGAGAAAGRSIALVRTRYIAAEEAQAESVAEKGTEPPKK